MWRPLFIRCIIRSNNSIDIQILSFPVIHLTSKPGKWMIDTAVTFAGSDCALVYLSTKVNESEIYMRIDALGRYLSTRIRNLTFLVATNTSEALNEPALLGAKWNIGYSVWVATWKMKKEVFWPDTS